MFFFKIEIIIQFELMVNRTKEGNLALESILIAILLQNDVLM